MALQDSGAPVYPEDTGAQGSSYGSAGGDTQGKPADKVRQYLASPLAWMLVILAYAVFVRVWNIADKVMHHDESLFAYYGYWLFRGNGYDYQPILHGPVLQFVSAFFFLLFGDDQFSMRLPSLLGGLGMFAVLWYWRRYLGAVGVVAAFLLLALSPSITYYTRFLRNDVPYLTVTMWCGLCLVRLFDTGRSLYAWGALFSSALAFSMMESSIFFFSACLGFLGTIVLWDWILGRKKEPVGDDSYSAPHRPPMTELQFFLICPLIALLITTFLGWLFWRVLYGAIQLYKPVVAVFDRYGYTLQPDDANWLIAFVVFVFVWLICLAAFLNYRRPYGRKGVANWFLQAMWINRWALVGGLAIAIAAYQTLFTTFFTHTETASFSHNQRDFKGPIKALTPVQIYQNTWDYWWDQHKLHRIKGPFHYYMPILGIYELPLLLIVAWGWIRTVLRRHERWLHISLLVGLQLLTTATYFLLIHGVKLNWDWLPERLHITLIPKSKVDWDWMDKKFHVTHWFHLNLVMLFVQLLVHIAPLLFFTGRRVEAFLTYWAVTSLFAYSYAGEKVPWLTVHTVGPLVLLGGIQLNRLWHLQQHWLPRTRTLAAVVLGIAVLYQVRNQHYLNFVQPHSPAERLVYNHTSPDLKEALDVIDDIGRQTGFGRQLPMFIEGEMAWPLHWYLRRHPNAFATHEKLDTTTRPVILVDWTHSNNTNLNTHYIVRRMKVREWWETPLLDFTALSDIWRMFTPLESRRGGLNAAAYQKSVLEWKKLWHYLAYREIWLDPMNPDWSNGANEFAFGIRKDLEDTYNNFNWLGLLQKRRDINVYP